MRLSAAWCPATSSPLLKRACAKTSSTACWPAIPMVGLHAKLYDGSYHPVDSSEMAFKTAARIAYKKGCMDASPVLLEPIMHVEVSTFPMSTWATSWAI